MDFPFLRTFDIWEGHSWAGGISGGTGNNQESSSEAVQSWGGLFLLGAAMGDHDMMGTGAMGYSMETSAALEYWLNVHHDTFPPSYPHPIAGMVWGGGNLFGTYFSGDPAWVYGIQWVPTSPMQNYLSRDPSWTVDMIHTMLGLQEKVKGTSTISSLGGQLGCAVMSVAAQANPDWSASQITSLITNGDPLIKDDWAGITYDWIYANRSLGTVRTDYVASIPTSAAYYNSKSKEVSVVVYNPENTESTATITHNGKEAATVTVPARSLAVKIISAGP
jgi:endoglucanase Acf2